MGLLITFLYRVLIAALVLRQSASSSTNGGPRAPTAHLQSIDNDGDVNATAIAKVGIIKSRPSTSTHKREERKTRDMERTKPNVKKVKQTSSSSHSSSATALRRLKKEYKDAVQMGICYDWGKSRLVTASNGSKNEQQQLICLGPLASNLRHWHFSFRGEGIYQSGVYHGRIILPKTYPATPPRIQLWTPSGRFVPLADICLSASAYHPESWTPRWTVLSLVQALRLHMLTAPQEIGAMISSREETLEYARQSLEWKLSWRVGKTLITVDHAHLLAQRVLSVDQDTPEQAVQVLDQPPADPTPPHTDLSQEFKPTPTKKRKTKRSRSSKLSRDRKPALPRRTPKAVRSIHGALQSTISKLFASPTPIAVVSLLLILWILSS